MDFETGRNLVYKQARENPTDVSLLHNKAVFLAIDMKLNQSNKFFE